MAFSVSRERFELLTTEAVGRLPKHFRELMRNVVVFVEDLPSAEEAGEVGVSRDDLLGLFRGVPYEDEESFFDALPPMPNEIILFQRNLEAICESEPELIEEIRETIAHEVGHYFGLSDEGMDEL